jgi:Flp pilus assembly protein TadG
MRPRGRAVPAQNGHGHDDRGVVLVFVALAMIALLAVAAIVVDIGRLRQTRRSSQSATDLAALSAGYYLSGRGSPEGTVISDPRAACTAALNSLRANVSDLPAATSLPCDTLPSSGLAPECTASTLPQTLTATGAAPYTVSIEYPVPASEITDARFKDGVGFSDGTLACERLRVRLGRVNEGLFSGIVGINSLSTGASSIVRSDTAQIGQGVAALLLLERVSCGVLQTSGGGSSGAGVVVQSSGPGYPGTIQADSAGQTPPCTTNTNADGFVAYGTPLPAASGGGPSIQAQPSSDGMPGILGLRSLLVGGRGAAVEGTGVTPAATPGNIMSRTPADLKYNKAAAKGGNAQITNLHTRGYTATTMTQSAATAAGYTVIGGSDCNGLDTNVTPVTATKVFFNCTTFSPSLAILPNATDVVFAGRVDVANNMLLSLPNARRVYARGCATSCSGGNNYSISIAGELRINTGGDGTTTPACSTRSGPGANGTTTNWTELATFGGPFLVTNQIRMCQTFVYLGQNAATYSIRTQQSIGVPPENYAPVAACSVTLPCPTDGAGTAAISMSGGAASGDWTAPNQLKTVPTTTDLVTYPFEDLALWAEASSPSFIKGQGSNRTEGIFFTPNSAMTFTGQATQSQPLNAQFISRSLNVSGQGTLNLKPSPEDSIRTPLPGNSSLIR